jgi:predicted secreted protein
VIETLHEAAGRQLDAVDYAYERMLLELSEVLPDVTENRTVCRANRDEAYAEAADLDQISTEMAQQLVAACEPAKRKSQKKRESQKSVAA